MSQTAHRTSRAFVAAILLARAAAAGPSPQDRERQVNSFITGAQALPAVASDPAGNFVVVWQSLGSVGNDTSLFSIQAQRYDPLGRKVGSQIQVNTYTAGNQRNPAVGMNCCNGFTVVWESDGSNGGDNSLRSIQGQFILGGEPYGPEFQVNSYTTGEQFAPAVAVDRDNYFLVVWASNGSDKGDTLSTSIQAQYGNLLGPVGSQFQVNEITVGPQEFPAVGVDFNGNYLVAWKHNGAATGIDDPLSVQAQRVAWGGTMTGGQFQVNTYTPGIQSFPAVAGSGNGDFLVAWHADLGPLPDNDPPAIEAAVFNSLGGAVTGEFQVNTYTPGHQDNPRVAMSPSGDFVVAWHGSGSAESDNAPGNYSIHAQRYYASGEPREAEFQVNTWTTNDQKSPGVAMDSLGNFVIVWQSAGSFDGDGNDTSVQQRRFDALFRDGFEVSGTSRWSQTVT